MRAYERFLEYIKINTQSSQTEEKHPSTENQFVLANLIKQELKELGVEDIIVTENCYIYGKISATPGFEDAEVIGFISHMDTAPAFSSENIKASIVENYQGKDIILNPELDIVLSPDMFPELRNYIGQSIIVTDGTTLLGADDKAGIAEIITAVQQIISSGISHGEIRIGFTPDEEIGKGADLFDVDLFGASYAYTIDGGELGEIEYENFNAAEAKVLIKGNCIHPGEGKNKMKNASLIAMEFNSMLPDFETPEHTEGYEGFYHILSVKGNEEAAELDYIIRDHDYNKFQDKKKQFRRIGQYLNEKYAVEVVEVELKDSYYNMKKMIEPKMYIVENAIKAMEYNNVKPLVKPIRGGTDGARLSYMGLPCPNLSAGGHNFHGKYEYVPIESMDKMVDVIVTLVEK